MCVSFQIKGLERDASQHKDEMAILGAESESLSSQLQSATERLEASDCRVTELTEEINTAKVWQPQCTRVYYSPETSEIKVLLLMSGLLVW